MGLTGSGRADSTHGTLSSTSPRPGVSCLQIAAVRAAQKSGCTQQHLHACSWAGQVGACSFLLPSWDPVLLRGSSGAEHGPAPSPSALLPGNFSISKARRASAALTSTGKASHLLLCTCITARQGDTNEKRAISQSSDCESLRSQRARREGVMGKGSVPGRLLQG